MIKLKRAYETAELTDGYRVLVERLWPRGITKEEAALNLWLKDVAPTPELRKWFNHDPAKWEEFRARYRGELQANQAPVEQLTKLVQNGDVTFVYGAKDTQHNAAVVLKEFVEARS
ncbi:MAG: DUF488 domain-containing protein [Armatimonadetes bacterium]|nr:DUF488 domain-containing protein [Armatimonadota bacterium]